MGGAKGKAEPRALECSRDHQLRYDPQLRGPNTVRGVALPGQRVRLEAIVALGAAAHEWVSVTAQIVDREHASSPDGPSLVLTGIGDGSTWRICAWAGWAPKYAIPNGASFAIVGGPSSWPESWS